MPAIDLFPRCRSYVISQKVNLDDPLMNEYWFALSVAESFPDAVLTKFGGLDFWNMKGPALLKRMEEFLENRSKSKPNRPQKIMARVEKRKITHAQIEACKTEKGGWTRETLKLWGVPHPPPKGWKKGLVKHGVPYSQFRS